MSGGAREQMQDVPALRFRMGVVSPTEAAENAKGETHGNTGRARILAGPWERMRLGDLADFNPKCTLPESFEYVDLESVVGTVMLSHRTESRGSAPSRAQRLAKFGDVFYQTVRPYQKNNYMFSLLDACPFVFSTGYAQLRPHGDSYFLLSLLQNDSVVARVLDECAGTSYPAISDSRLADIQVSFPIDLTEQRKIGTVFRSLDILIDGREKALGKLESLKKAMLQKMFPQGDSKTPELRFKGFEGEWEVKRLGSFLEPRDENNKSGAITEILSVLKDVGVVRYSEKGNIGNRAKEDITQYNIARSGDIVLNSMNVIIGSVGVTPIDGCISPAYYALVPNENACSAYWGYWFWRKETQVIISSLACGMMEIRRKISPSDLLSIMVAAPSRIEQEKIGAYFRSLDALLAARREEVAKLRDLKKALLERMFV